VVAVFNGPPKRGWLGEESPNPKGGAA